MNIGFDAKRYFHNPTGLGNYSRTLVNGLAHFYPQHRYFLFNPKPTQRFNIPEGLPLQQVLPHRAMHKMLPSYWRSKGLLDDLRSNKIQLYHGLSHEIPVGVNEMGICSVVTVHDLIFERYPEQYGTYELLVHRRKIKHACNHAAAVIAISQQTKQDLVDFYKVPEAKISVCYQSCDPQFALPASEAIKNGLQKSYNLPAEFFLYVGSITERKNLLRICEAMEMAKGKINMPLVVVGSGGKYAQKVKSFVRENGLSESVIFTTDRKGVDDSFDLKETKNLAALYQMATAMIYPSIFEGFGIPVLEALWSRVPVITSNTSCLPETGGDAALYINPQSAKEIAEAMVRLQEDAHLRQQLIARGLIQAQKFSLETCTRQVMTVYQKILDHGSL